MSLRVDVHKKLKGFDLNVSFQTDGSDLGILGASGCGKSMTLKCIAGIVKPDSGKIELDGRVLYDSEQKIDLPPQKRRVGYLFQHYALFPNMTVTQNIAAGLKLPRENREQKVDEMLRLLSLEDLGGRYPSQLSGGQQQRVALARILASDPDVLLLDEPFSALDFYLKEKLQIQLLDALGLYRGETVMVSHSRDEIYRFCGNTIVMGRGRCLIQGETKKLFKEPGEAEAARLTGCKNLTRIRVRDDGAMEALDWGVILESSRPSRGQIAYAGIRAHYFEPGYGEVPQGKNIIPVSDPVVSDGPFEVNIIFRKLGTADCSDDESRENHEIWWKVGKDRWRDLVSQKGMPSYLKVSPRDVMPLR